jgi:hypothetical protein
MAIIAGPSGSMQQGGPLATIAPSYIPTGGAPGGGGFEELLNKLRGLGSKGADLGRRGAEKLATPTGTRIAGLGAPAAFAAGSLMQGDVLGAAGELGGGLAGAGLVGGIAKGLEAGGARGKLLGAGVRLAGGLIGGGIGGAVAGGVGNMLGGATQAAQDALGEAGRRQMAQGQSPGVIPGTGGKGIERLSMEQLKELVMTQPEVMERLLPTINRERDAQMSRQMQLNQQLGQLTGALNQQKYMAELAGGAQSEAGATTRTMLTAPNPYASSAFQYRG